MGKNDGGECDLLETHGIAARLPARLCLGIFRHQELPLSWPLFVFPSVIFPPQNWSMLSEGVLDYLITSTHG